MRMTPSSTRAAGFTLLAVGLMIVSTILYAPADRSTNPPLIEATIAALLGGAALWYALRLSTHKVEAQPVTRQPMSGGSAQWWLIVPGLVLLAVGTEMSANVLQREYLETPSPHVQFVTLFAGLVLFALGMIGVRRVTLPRINARYALLIGLIVAVGFSVRGCELDQLVRLSVDEGHHLGGVYAFFDPDFMPRMLTTTSGILPAAMFYEYFNYLTALVWGRNLVGLRMENAILGALTILPVYGVGRTLFNRRIGIIAALIMATFPVHVFFSRISLPHIADAFFCILAILFAIRAYQGNRRSDWILMGVFVGMAQHFFEAARLLIPPLFLCWFVLTALLLRGKFRVLGRGALLAIITSIVVVAPMYFTMWYTQAPFNSRLTSSGIDLNLVQRGLQGTLDGGEAQYLIDHVTDPFLVYTFHTHRGLMEMYGGSEPLVLRVCVPLFLLGIFHALWRLRSGTNLLLMAIFATSVGNIFVADAVIFPRYVVVMPVLALFVGIGLGCTLPMLNPFPRGRFAFGQIPTYLPSRRRLVSRPALAVYCVALLFAGIQLHYFRNHLIPEFNYSVRAQTHSGDLFDAGFRYLERTNARHEQMIIYDSGPGVINTVNELLAFSLAPLDYWAEMYLSTDITRETLDNLPRDRTYVFFVLPSDERMTQLLHESFTLEPPAYTRQQIPVARSLYAMYVARQSTNQQPRSAEPSAEHAFLPATSSLN